MDNWNGCLVKIKQEWLEPGERDIPYLVIEDRDDRVLIQELREYAKWPLLGTYCWSKEYLYIFDSDARMGLQDKNNSI